MDKVLKKAAEILVECGYAARQLDGSLCSTDVEFVSIDGSDDSIVRADPFADTLQGRRQADAIEDWLVKNNKLLWRNSMSCFGFDDRPKHQWRLDRIKWCLEKLGEDNG
jgi:hypothetical protein